jgi:hypothetical protein
LSGVIDIPVLSLQDSCDVQAFDLQEGQVSAIVASHAPRLKVKRREDSHA